MKWLLIAIAAFLLYTWWVNNNKGNPCGGSQS